MLGKQVLLRKNERKIVLQECRAGRVVVAHAFNRSTREAERISVSSRPACLQELVPGQEPKAMAKPCLKNQKKKKLCFKDIVRKCLQWLSMGCEEHAGIEFTV